jgi:hypothetical protein
MTNDEGRKPEGGAGALPLYCGPDLRHRFGSGCLSVGWLPILILGNPKQ